MYSLTVVAVYIVHTSIVLYVSTQFAVLMVLINFRILQALTNYDSTTGEFLVPFRNQYTCSTHLQIHQTGFLHTFIRGCIQPKCMQTVITSILVSNCG